MIDKIPSQYRNSKFVQCFLSTFDDMFTEYKTKIITIKNSCNLNTAEKYLLDCQVSWYGIKRYSDEEDDSLRRRAIAKATQYSYNATYGDLFVAIKNLFSPRRTLVIDHKDATIDVYVNGIKYLSSSILAKSIVPAGVNNIVLYIKIDSNESEINGMFFSFEIKSSGNLYAFTDTMYVVDPLSEKELIVLCSDMIVNSRFNIEKHNDPNGQEDILIYNNFFIELT